MKETIIIICAIAFSTLASAQTQKKATIRIKEVKKIDGVETIRDTTFEADNTSIFKLDTDEQMISTLEDKNAKASRIVIKHHKVDTLGHLDDLGKLNDDLDVLEMEKLLNTLKIEGADPNKKQVFLFQSKDGKGMQDLKKLDYIPKSSLIQITILDPDAKEREQLSAKELNESEQLKIENLDFFPNPNQGKFMLKFNLATKGDTKVSIVSAEGKVVYHEALDNFSGAYQSEINISEQAKGIYFMKVEQNGNVHLKKIVLE